MFLLLNGACPIVPVIKGLNCRKAIAGIDIYSYRYIAAGRSEMHDKVKKTL